MVLVITLDKKKSKRSKRYLVSTVILLMNSKTLNCPFEFRIPRAFVTHLNNIRIARHIRPRQKKLISQLKGIN